MSKIIALFLAVFLLSACETVKPGAEKIADGVLWYCDQVGSGARCDTRKEVNGILNGRATAIIICYPDSDGSTGPENKIRDQPEDDCPIN